MDKILKSVILCLVLSNLVLGFNGTTVDQRPDIPNFLRVVFENNLSIEEKRVENGVRIFTSRQTFTKNMAPQSICLPLAIGLGVHWYGGPQYRYQYWPVENSQYINFSYVSKEEGNTAITERYWLNSNGIFIYIDEDVPLFIDQNGPDSDGKLCFIANPIAPYNSRSEEFSLSFKFGIGVNSRVAHMAAVKHILGKPSDVPDERMVRYPIWSTWARYKTEVDEKVVNEFADEIIANKFQNSQFELDDDWEVCYGALTFRETKFPNITRTVEELKAKGFRVTLWIHPFINKGCDPWYSEAMSKGYLVRNHNNETATQWWNSQRGEAVYIDFTNPNASEWYTNRLKELLELGIDSFKFDAGETSWSPPDPIQNGPIELQPSLITRAYVTTVAKFGPLVEVRSGQGTQNLPIFMRMIDKDSEWGWNNGLPTLVTTLLQLNMVGYPFVLPDMIGGNGYNNHTPEKELFIRWLQANVFMPSLQFSYVPWDYDNETISISHSMVDLHSQYTDKIMQLMHRAVETGEPINTPIWWIDPYDRVAHGVNDQYLLGEDLMVAPVLTEGTVVRDIYFPRGTWRDENTQQIIEGPQTVTGYNAPLQVLPYFTRIKA